MKTIFCCIGVCVLASIVHISILKIHSSEERSKLLELANSVLEEQVADISNQLLIERSELTYEDGLRDGIMNSKSQEYMAGYHKGIADQSYHIFVGNQMSATEIGVRDGNR